MSLLLGAIGFASGCNKDDDGPEPIIPFTGSNQIVIHSITDIPKDVTFNKVKLEITGDGWQVIDNIEAAYRNGKFVLKLPELPSDKLQKAVRDDWTDYTGFWPAATDNPAAKVAKLGDVIAYNDDEIVGRLELTDWGGAGSTTGKSWIYYHYTDQDFTLSGYNYSNPKPDPFTGQPVPKSFKYEASFKKGWNAYANVNATGDGIVVVTAPVPAETALRWRFLEKR